MASCAFFPPSLLRRLDALVPGAASEPTGLAENLRADAELRGHRIGAPHLPADRVAPGADYARWVIHTAAGTRQLPGAVVHTDRPESGDDDPHGAASDATPVVDDAAIAEAHDALRATWRLFADEFSYSSVDGHGTPLSVTVHFGQRYANAFWDGRQLVAGDGDGIVFDRFTRSPDVLAHEFVHGVTQYTAGLGHEGEPGAVNESICDVFASMVKQRLLGQAVESADWLLGEDLLLPGVRGRAVRSLRDPGGAYDDPRIGCDPQVAEMASYLRAGSTGAGADAGPVDEVDAAHINAGIANRAFYLAATGLGGHSWTDAGSIWWAALVSGSVTADTGFTGFAAATVSAAGRLYGPGSAEVRVTRDAWREVGVVITASHIIVRRTGGFAGRAVERSVDVADVAELLGRVDLHAMATREQLPPQPDRYAYRITTDLARVELGEPEVTPELQQLIDRVLGEGGP